jgi:hypothetical protein
MGESIDECSRDIVGISPTETKIVASTTESVSQAFVRLEYLTASSQSLSGVVGEIFWKGG